MFVVAVWGSFGTAPMPEAQEEINNAVEFIEIKTPEKIVAETFGHGSVMYKIANCESGFNTKAVGDGNLICNIKSSPFYGKPVRSRGVWQINECAYPEITDELAFDAEWSTRWAKERHEAGATTKEWTNCYKKVTN